MFYGPISGNIFRTCNEAKTYRISQEIFLTWGPHSNFTLPKFERNLTNRPGYNAGELCVHGYIWEPLDNLAYDFEFFVEVVCPDFANSAVFIGGRTEMPANPCNR